MSTSSAYLGKQLEAYFWADMYYPAARITGGSPVPYASALPSRPVPPHSSPLQLQLITTKID